MDELDKRDPELARALASVLAGGSDAEFTNRVMAAADGAGMFEPAEWWEVLGEWARPGLVAVAATISLLVGATLITPRTRPEIVSLAEGLIVGGEVAELAEPIPPDPETMMAIMFTVDRP